MCIRDSLKEGKIPPSSLGTYVVPARTKENPEVASASTWKPSSVLPPPKPTFKGSGNPESARDKNEEARDSAEAAYKEASPTVFAVRGSRKAAAEAATQL